MTSAFQNSMSSYSTPRAGDAPETEQTSEQVLADHLERVPAPPGQSNFLISFVSPYMRQKADVFSMRFLGTYPSEKEAREAAQKHRDKNPLFDVYVGETGVWMPVAPDPKKIQDKNYAEEELNRLMSGNKDEIDKSKDVFMGRKREMVERARFQGSSRGQELLGKRRESWISVRFRQQDLEQQLENLQERKRKIEKDIPKLEERLEETNRLAATYTEEERSAAEAEYEKNLMGDMSM